MQPTQAAWREVFFLSAAVYIACSTFYQIFGSGVRQPWDNPQKDKVTNKQNPNIEETAQ